MLKKIGSVKKLAKKVKVIGGGGVARREPSQQHESLLREYGGGDEGKASGPAPTGFLAIYVGEERERFVVPTGYLSHPLFKMLLEKASDEFGFDQRNGLAVPCSVNAFLEVVSAIECSHGKFDFGKLVEEFI